MILRGLTASPPVQGVTVQDPIDQGSPVGFSAVGAGGWWTASPSPNFAVSALGVVGATANIDWSAAGYFSFTTTPSTALTITFATTATAALAAAAQVNSFSLGQTIRIRITGGGTSAAITWPATVAWIGMLTGTGGSSQSAPVWVTTKLLDVVLTCTGTGSAPTFDGIYMTGT